MGVALKHVIRRIAAIEHETVSRSVCKAIVRQKGTVMQKYQSGFTLIELAIVLVVIGLLLGGVLKGQELVLNSQIRNSINEFNNVASARFAYQDRYRQIPGDDNTAATRWGATVNNGNGNRLIDGNWNDTAVATSEAGIFWHHLRNDGLVSGPRSNAATNTFALPRNAFDGDIGVQEDFGPSGAETILGTVICQSNIPVKAAIIIDTRIDDDPGDGTGGDTGSLQGNATADARAAATDYTGSSRFLICRQL